MTDLLELLDRYQTTTTPIAGFELAADRGNLSEAEEEELATMKRTAASLHEQARVRWEAARADEIAAFDARVDALLGSTRSDPWMIDAKRRAPATRSPQRAFDAWAIYITLKLTA